MPGMDDEPQSTFTNLSVLFTKLGISEGVDGENGENGENGDGGDSGGSRNINWREQDTEVLKRALDTPPKSPPSSRSWRDMDKPSSPTPNVRMYGSHHLCRNYACGFHRSAQKAGIILVCTETRAAPTLPCAETRATVCTDWRRNWELLHCRNQGLH